MSDRVIALEAVHNFRDLGGYSTADGGTTRWNTLYRADGLYRATHNDVTDIDTLGIQTVIDLRTIDELNERGSFADHAPTIDFHHVPVLDLTWQQADRPVYDQDVDFLVWAYQEMIRVGSARFATAMTLLAQPSALPAVFHCAAGKDRTGLLAAFILGSLGVSDSDIVADYALTADRMEVMRQWALQQDPSLSQRMADVPSAIMAALPEAMQTILDEVRETHGSIKQFVLSIGVSPETLEQLRIALIQYP